MSEHRPMSDWEHDRWQEIVNVCISRPGGVEFGPQSKPVILAVAREMEELRALLREALEDQYAQHAPGCSGAWGEEAICKCGYHDWRKRAEEAIR